MNILVGLVMVVLGAGLCAYAWFMRWLGSTIQSNDSQVAAAGVDGEAEVVDHRTISGRSGRAYYISFEYTINPPGGQPYKIRRETSISGDDYQRLGLGAKVAIRYLPNAPNSVILRQGDGEQTAPTFMTGSIWVFVIGAATIIFGIVLWFR